MTQSFGITEYPNTFKRQAAFPLDNYSVFKSLQEANKYAESNKVAYEGQLITVTENHEIKLFVLKNSTDIAKNFELINIPIAEVNIEDTVININNLINSKVGIWNATKNNDSEAVLDFDIWYSIEADSYEVFFNDELISNRLLLSDEFSITFENFESESYKMILKFYKDETEVFELEAKPTYKNSTVICGSLYLNNLL